MGLTGHAASLFAACCGVMILFNLAVAAGAPWGQFTQGGRSAGRLGPGGRAVAVLSAAVLGFMGLAVLSAAGLPGPDWPRWTGWLALGLAGATAALNRISPSEGERRLWGPMGTVMAALALVAMTGA